MTKEEFLKKIGNRKFLFFDTETTGLYAMEKYAPDEMEERDASGNVTSIIKKEDYVWDDMIEIGYILYDPLTEKEILSGEHLLKPDKEISDVIYGVTGISNEMVKEKGISKQELYEIMKPILDENPILIAFNTKFDITFIYKWLLEIDAEKYKYFNFDVMDVMTIYANYFPFSKEIEYGENHAGIQTEKKYGHRLVGAMKALCNRELKQTHRALDDIEETIVVFNELQKHFNVYDFVNILGYHPATREMRYFYSLKPYHVIVFPISYNGGDNLHKLAAGENVAEYKRMLIPKWVFTQDFTARLRDDFWKHKSQIPVEKHRTYEQAVLFTDEDFEEATPESNTSTGFKFIRNRKG